MLIMKIYFTFFTVLLSSCNSTIVEISFWHFPTFEGSNNELSVLLKQSAYLNSKFTTEFYLKCSKNSGLLVQNNSQPFTQIYNPFDFRFIDNWHFSDNLNETRLREFLTENTKMYNEMNNAVTVIVTSKKLISSYFNSWRFQSSTIDFNITSCKVIVNGAKQYVQRTVGKKTETFLAQYLHQYSLQGFISANEKPLFFNRGQGKSNTKISKKTTTYSPLITIL